MKRLLVVVGCWLAFAGGADAQPRRAVPLRVVDVAGGRAYLEPGEEAGLRAGMTVSIGGRELVIVAVTRTSAVVETNGRALDVGARGSARVASDAATTGGDERAEVVPLERFEGQWPVQPRPADAQHPTHVPLGRAGREVRARFLLASATTAYVPFSGNASALVRQQLRAGVHAEPFRNVPFAIDANATLQIYAARDLAQRPGGASRPILRVNQLQISYGRDREFYAALGRLATAGQSVGMLDGVRLRTPTFGGVRLGAFGGLVPGLFDNAPSVSASRFGLEASYEAPDAKARPTVSLLAQGSFFDGRVDERRLTSSAYLMPDFGRFGAYAAVDLHDRVNPWNAHAVEVSWAGAEASLRFGPWQGGVRFDYRRPERTRWLASQLPISWLCGGLGNENVPCQVKGDGRYFVSADTSVRSGHVVLTGGGSYVRTPTADTSQASAFVQLRIVEIANAARVSLTASGYGGSLLRSYAVAAEAGAMLLDERLDVGLHYRPSIQLYTAEASPTVNHLFGGAVRFLPRREWSASASIDGLAGPDLRALLVQAVLVWRPEVE